MQPFSVVLEGTWLPDKWNDIAGFFATRVVLAQSPDEAAETARRRLLTELPSELPGCPEPRVRIDAIYEVEADRLLEKTTGFSFYSDGE